MHFLSTLPQVSRATLVAFGIGAAAGAIFLWLLVHFSRKRVVELVHNEATAVLANQIGRVAEAVERLSLRLELKPTPVEAPTRGEIGPAATRPAPAQGHINLSMLGR